MTQNALPEGAAAGSAAGLSALGSAIGLCCVGPWSVAVFGVSGAIFLNRLAPFRPLIMIAAAGLLAWSFWRVYQPLPPCNEGTCARRQTPILKAALWFSAGLLLLAFFAPDLQSLLLRSASFGETQ